MSMKKKIASLIFGKKEEKAETAQAGPALAGQAQPEPGAPESPDVMDGSPNQYILELPAEHQIFRLYDQCRQEYGYLPRPRLCLDEEGRLPAETVNAEMGRLRTLIAAACSARLKEVRGQSKSPGKKKRRDVNDREEPEEHREGPPVLGALPCFFLSADKMLAWLLVFPPTQGGAELSRNLLHRAMDDQGISYGVDTRVISQIGRSDRKYFTLYLIARGKPAFDGKNGNIVDNFPRAIERTLEVDEYDRVNYAELNLIHNVEQGQEICRLIKPTEGEPGRSVLDETVPAKSGKEVPLPVGRNTKISEDGTQLLATISGSVQFTGRSFQVNPVLDISGDVDFSTGNLNFMGDINIQGSVLSGFTVRAMGNIRVGGVVEAGSIVEAGGDLVVVKGILGDGTTTVQAHRSIFSKYVENATISVRENLQTDCIIGSSIYCGGEIIVQSGRGSIMGGRVWAGRRIRANCVGSHSECKTTITLGGRPCENFEREVARQKVNALEMELERLSCQPESPVRSSLVAKAKVRLLTAEMKLRQLDERDEDLDEDDDGDVRGRLECAVAYPGTRIHMGEEVLRLHHVERRCVVTMVEGEIVVM